MRAVLTELAREVVERRELTSLSRLIAEPVREVALLMPVPGRLLPRLEGAQGIASVGQPR